MQNMEQEPTTRSSLHLVQPSKREQILSLLSDPETANLSNYQIAEMCKTDESYVRKVRKLTTTDSTTDSLSNFWKTPTTDSTTDSQFVNVGMVKHYDITNIGHSPKKSKIVYSSVYGKNADLIAQVVKLYAFPGASIADVTWGKGAFWKAVDLSRYNFHPSDIKDGIDFRDLPYENNTFDVVVLDPPYAHNPGTFMTDDTYNNNATTKGMGHDDIQQLYRDGMQEAYRVLKDGGLLWVKCQDEIESGKQRYSHIEIYETALQLGFYAKDLFILKQDTSSPVQRKQQHAKKNHSYLWIFRRLVLVRVELVAQ